MTGPSLLVGFFISLGGMAAFAYGKKTNRFVPLIGGLVLMIYPYFVSNVFVMGVVAVGLVVGMILIRED